MSLPTGSPQDVIATIYAHTTALWVPGCKRHPIADIEDTDRSLVVTCLIHTLSTESTEVFPFSTSVNIILYSSEVYVTHGNYKENYTTYTVLVSLFCLPLYRNYTVLLKITSNTGMMCILIPHVIAV